MDIVIREALDEDSPAVAALIEPIFAEYDGVLFIPSEMPELDAIASAFQRDGGVFLVALHDSAVVGCVGYTPAAEGIELKKLYVAKSERRHGLGAMLTERVEQAARERNAAFVELWSDAKFTAAHRFYERRGYERDGRTRELHDESGTVEYYFRRGLK